MKKFLVGSVAAAAMVFPMSAGATEYPDGDANCSGTVTPLDAITVIRSILEFPGWEIGDCGAKIDLNCSGSVTPADAYLITRIMRGIEIPSC